jgi:hypothetical protein
MSDIQLDSAGADEVDEEQTAGQNNVVVKIGLVGDAQVNNLKNFKPIHI